VCDELIGGALVDESGMGYVDESGYFGGVGEFIGPAILEHIIKMIVRHNGYKSYDCWCWLYF
jgi:hypothetical protein